MKIALLSASQQSLQAIQSLLGMLAEHQVKALVGDSKALPQLLEQYVPDVLLCEYGTGDTQLLEVLAGSSARQSQLTPILLTPHPTPELLIEAMRAGVREVLPLPLDKDALAGALLRVRKQRLQATSASRHGKVLAFIPCKGGSGSTFIAANLAYTLANSNSECRVLLIDLNLQFGDAALFLCNDKPPSNLAELLRHSERLDAALLTSSLLWLNSRFGILAAPEDPASAMEIQAAHIETLLKLACREFDFVVLDLGRTLDPVSIRALDLADHIYPVLQATLPFIRDAKRMLDIFAALGYPADKTSLLINRHTKDGDIRQSDIERTLQQKIAHTLPNNYHHAAASVNQGVPLAKLAPSCPLTHALTEFARTLAPQQEASKPWWGKWLGHKPSYTLATDPGYKA